MVQQQSCFALAASPKMVSEPWCGVFAPRICSISLSRTQESNFCRQVQHTIMFTVSDHITSQKGHSLHPIIMVVCVAGDGHFSPVGGFHAQKDMVLILDTARFKYPPHWVSLSALYKAMASLDAVTGKPRGFIRIGANPRLDSVMFTLNKPNRCAFFMLSLAPITTICQWHGCSPQMRNSF